MIKAFLTRKFGIPLWVLIAWVIFTLAILALAAGTTKLVAQTATGWATMNADPWTAQVPATTATWVEVDSEQQIDVLDLIPYRVRTPYLTYSFRPETDIWPGRTTYFEEYVEVDHEREW